MEEVQMKKHQFCEKPSFLWDKAICIPTLEFNSPSDESGDNFIRIPEFNFTNIELLN